MGLMREPFDDHHAFHEDAKPGDLSLQLLPIRWRSSSNQLVTMMNRSGSEATPSGAVTDRNRESCVRLDPPVR